MAEVALVNSYLFIIIIIIIIIIDLVMLEN
jgi:hypothetical protein